ncbi:MAG: DUF308 domain-containing protein [Methanoregula sp.]|nr:DUF308 domain-containing protein [Methanoregula sp.]
MTETMQNPNEMVMENIRIFPWWLVLLWGILSLILGIMFLATPGITTVLLITFIGAYWLVSGIFALCSLAIDRSNMGWKIFLAIINILAGIVILAYPFFSTVLLLSFFVILIGFWGCVIGISHLYHAVTAKDTGNGLIGLISLLFGLLLLIFPLITAALIPYIIGAGAIVSGIAAIVVSFTAKKCQGIPS